MKARGEFRVRLSLDGKLLGSLATAKKIRRLLSEGTPGRLHVTFVPCIAGGARRATLLGDPAAGTLARSVRLHLERFATKGRVAEVVYRIPARRLSASSPVKNG